MELISSSVLPKCTSTNLHRNIKNSLYFQDLGDWNDLARDVTATIESHLPVPDLFERRMRYQKEEKDTTGSYSPQSWREKQEKWSVCSDIYAMWHFGLLMHDASKFDPAMASLLKVWQSFEADCKDREHSSYGQVDAVQHS